MTFIDDRVYDRLVYILRPLLAFNGANRISF